MSGVNRMKTKIICCSIIVLAILCAGTTTLKRQLSPKTIKASQLENYCLKHNGCDAKSFYVKKIDNYYYCVSVGGNNKKSDELFIFKEYDEKNHLVDYYGGNSSLKSTHRNTVSWYESTLESNKEKSIGDTIIFYSDNRDKICKGIISIKENNEVHEQVYDLDAQGPFIFKIDELGKIDDVMKDVVEYHFYNEAGKEVMPIAK